MMTPLIQADTTTINQSMMTRTPLLQDGAPSFNQAIISNSPLSMLIQKCKIISDAEQSDTNKNSKWAQASGTNCLFTSVGLRCMKLPCANDSFANDSWSANPADRTWWPAWM